MLDNPCATDVNGTEQPIYQPVIDCTYWPVLRSLNNWNIVRFTNKTTSGEYFDEVHQVFIDGISENK